MAWNSHLTSPVERGAIISIVQVTSTINPLGRTLVGWYVLELHYGWALRLQSDVP